MYPYYFYLQSKPMSLVVVEKLFTLTTVGSHVTLHARLNIFTSLYQMYNIHTYVTGVFSKILRHAIDCFNLIFKYVTNKIKIVYYS